MPTNNSITFSYSTFSQFGTAFTDKNTKNLNAGDAYPILVRGSRAANVTSNTNGSNPPDDTVLRTTRFLQSGDFIISQNVNPSIS